MGLAMEVSDFFVTAGGAQSFTAMTAYSGSVASVRDFADPAAAWLAGLWANEATDNQVRVRSPRMHDNVQGIMFDTTPAICRDLLSEYAVQRLYPSDTLVQEATSEAAETDGLAYVIFYDDMPGVAANLFTFDALAPRIVNLVNVEVDLAAPSAVAVRTAQVALNGTFDLLKSDTEYALLGWTAEIEGLSIGIMGPDTGNLRVGGPLSAEKIETRDYFVRISKRLNRPTVPVLHANNKAGTLIDATYNGAGAANPVTLCMAELSR